MGSSKGPYHDLDLIKELVGRSKYRTTKRVRDYLRNHGFIPHETVEDVVYSIEERHFYKTIELDHLPGVNADVYRKVECYEDEWYVKLFLDGEGSPYVQVWSLKENDYQF